MRAPHDASSPANWTRRPPGRARAAAGLVGGVALVAFAHALRGPGVAAVALATALLVLWATLRHEEVVRWSDEHGAVANLAIVPPAFVGLACALRSLPLATVALIALALGLLLAVLWVLVAERPAPAPTAVAPEPVEAPAAPARLWAREGAGTADG